MSELSSLSHNYVEWNSYLTSLNDWLLAVRKMRDGLLAAPEIMKIPKQVQEVLIRVVHSLNPSTAFSSEIPLTIKENLVSRLGTRTEEASTHILSLLQKPDLTLKDFSNEDIDLLRIIVSCLDEEVTDLHNRMHGYKG